MEECQNLVGQGDRHRDNWGHWFKRYTPLSADRGKVLDKALSVDLIPPPRRVASPHNADQTRRCRYHRNSGDTIEECQTLKDKIEKLIQVEHLQQFGNGDWESKRSPRWEEATRQRDYSPQRTREDDRRPTRRERGRGE